MRRSVILSMLVSVTLIGEASAQTGGWQFRWHKGQILQYRVEHTTSVAEVVEGSKVESSSKLNLVKRWQVLDVDARGVGTLQLSLASLRSEQTRPNGEPLIFDSQNLDQSTPELREQMMQYVGKPIAVLRVDPLGRVVQTLAGPEEKYEQEPPFALVLPGQALPAGQGWRRRYEVTLDPPFGTGEKYPATQTYQVKGVAGNRAELAVATEFEKLPESQADRIPLLQRMVSGQVTFDTQTGRTLATRAAINQTLQDHQGPASSYVFQSQYTETLIE